LSPLSNFGKAGAPTFSAACAATNLAEGVRRRGDFRWGDGIAAGAAVANFWGLLGEDGVFVALATGAAGAGALVVELGASVRTFVVKF